MLRLLCAVWFACLLGTAPVVGEETAPDDSLVQLKLDPERIEMGIFYRGATVRIAAQVTGCDGAVIVLAAGGEEVTLNRKGRVAGVWLNVAQVTASGVPQVYILATSDSLKNICSPEVQRQLGLGPEYLKNEMKFTCEKPLTGSEFDELLKLKTQAGTYNSDVRINLAPTGSGEEKLSAVLPIPPAVPPGTYRVQLYCFRGGQPVRQGEATLTIQRIGLAHLIAVAAHERAALYGTMAIVVAMIVGIGMGIIFNSLPGSGH